MRQRLDGQIDESTWWPVMALCVLCAQPCVGPDDVCAYHMSGPGDDWATSNRIMCDFVHRGILAPAPRERHDDIELLVSALD